MKSYTIFCFERFIKIYAQIKNPQVKNRVLWKKIQGLIIMNILGISAYYHDSAACLVRDGKIIAAAQEERFTRKKHDFNFPSNAIRYCLREGEVSGKKLDYVTFYDKPFIKFERLLETYLTYAPRGIKSFIKAMPVWLKQKLWIKELLKKDLGYEGQVIFPAHHE